MSYLKKISIIDRSERSRLSGTGMGELTAVLETKGVTWSRAPYFGGSTKEEISLVVGVCTVRLVEKLLRDNGVFPEVVPEGVILYRCETGGQEVLVLSGTDEKGLMYALFEAADEIRCKGIDSLLTLKNKVEYPQNKIRGVDRFLMSQRDDEWYYSTEFWAYFLRRLAKNRFNRFTLITGFDTAYMSPPYPFFLEVPGYQNVRVREQTEERREKNLKTLKRIGSLCASYGIEFIFSSWQQMPWTDTQNLLVEHIPEGDVDFTDYCVRGMQEILNACPEIAGLQFRVNLEAGIRGKGDKSDTHVSFWCAMIDGVASLGRKLKWEMRAKGLTDSMLEYAQKSGLEVAVATKYWCEHAALPYHIPQLRTEEMRTLENVNSSRRYSYDNLLKKPHWYDMIYRLWSYGSINLFLWGDPDYCKRFSKSCSLGGGAGFQVNSPLALKGGHESIPGDNWPVHVNDGIIDYRWEDERYWMYYLLYGRLGYNPDAGEEIWKRELALRFGPETGAAVEEAYRWSGKIMPLITTAHFPVHPSMHYWPELYAGAALFYENNMDSYFGKHTYGNSLPSDEALFYSIEQYGKDRRAGELKGKYNPLQVRDWLKSFADHTREALSRMEERKASPHCKELKAIHTDFSMLADIAQFHAWKIKAAYELERFYEGEGLQCLRESYGAMRAAEFFWAEAAAVGNENYQRNLIFDAGDSTSRNGNWQDRLEKEIRADIRCLLKLLRENAGEEPPAVKAENMAYESMCQSLSSLPVSAMADIPKTWEAGRELPLVLKLDELSRNGALGQVRLHYRHTNHTEGGYIGVTMERTAEGYRGVIPGDYLIPEWDINLYFSAVDGNGNGFIYPGLYHERYDGPYCTIEITGWRERGDFHGEGN